MDELQEELIPRLRALIDELVVHPATTGRGVTITITGRLAQIIELATGRQVDPAGMLTLERVKPLAHKHS